MWPVLSCALLGLLVEEAEHVFDQEIIIHIGRCFFRIIDSLDPNRVIAVIDLTTSECDHLRVPVIGLPPFLRLVDVGCVDVGAARAVGIDETDVLSIDPNQHIAN